MKIKIIAVAACLLCSTVFPSQKSTASPKQTGKTYNSDTTHNGKKKPVVKSKGKSSPENRTRDTSRKNMNPGTINPHNTMDEKRGNNPDSAR